ICRILRCPTIPPESGWGGPLPKRPISPLRSKYLPPFNPLEKYRKIKSFVLDSEIKPIGKCGVLPVNYHPVIWVNPAIGFSVGATSVSKNQISGPGIILMNRTIGYLFLILEHANPFQHIP